MITGTSRRVVDDVEAAAFRAVGWWSDQTLMDRVLDHARTRPDAVAYITESSRVTWAEVADASTRLAAALVATGVERGDRVAVWLADSPMLHVAFLAVEAAGGTIVGIGARAGHRELAHLLNQSEARVLITSEFHAGRATLEVVDGLPSDGLDLTRITVTGTPAALKVSANGEPVESAPLEEAVRLERRLDPDDLFLINSTSGTTGLPKCVLHTQNRWHYFHTQAKANGALTADDVFLGAVPAPFGFGLWTSHVTPIILGAPTVLLDRFTPEAALAAIEREGVTVLCCVSTQFIMMLTSPSLKRHDLTSLRVMFTGGEAVPYERAVDFERSAGVTTLQFYGSNETGLLCGTTLDDPPEIRLRTAGRVRPEMQVRLFDGDRDVTHTGRGQPACKGPALSLGYLDDAANEQLYTADGWMLMGDICELDADGYMTVVGRTSDFIIRGGKNVSAGQVEADVSTHPSVAHAAVVAMPDPIFGERVCAYVELTDGGSLTLDGLLEHLRRLGVSKELYPERLIVLDELPRSSGAKVAKGELRADIKQRVEAEATQASAPRQSPGAPQ